MSEFAEGDSVASPIEAQINGVDDMLYMSSTSSATGQLTLTVYFALDVDPDIAQVQVQNRVNLALPALPEAVQQSLAASIPFPPRLGKPSEFAELACHFVTNAHLNGEVIRLDGALRMAPR